MNMIIKVFILTSLLFSSSYSFADSNEDKVIEMAYHEIYKNKLTSTKGECLMFDFDNSNNEYYLISVRENHASVVCGGDSNVSVKMFDLRIDKKDRRVFTNQGRDSEHFRELKDSE
ncbi:hypothetical protein [Ewingella americana]|uniref:Uncharacterized protein n=1 Tax=Ewingella americana TaxID=41202 RepID=A0A502GB02_9GAMM|nr:hypothetical protein [Ewingella americana]TPG58852.1 hypothetical protein EAH77_18255 [Ewingella americana]